MPERGALIQSVGPQNIAQTTLGLKGGDVPQNILVPDLQGTIELGRRTEPELLFDQGIIPFAISVSIAAGGAGNFSFVSIRNESLTAGAQPKTVFVITGVEGVNDVAARLELYYGPDIGATVGNWFSRDLRFGARPIDWFGGGALPRVSWGSAALAGIATPALWRSRLLNSASGALAPFPPVVCRLADTNVHPIIALDVANLALEVNVSGYTVPLRGGV